MLLNFGVLWSDGNSEYFIKGMLAIVHAEEDWRADGCARKTRAQQGKIAVGNIFARFRESQRDRILERNTVEVKVGAG